MSILKKKLAAVEPEPEPVKLDPFHPSLWLDCSEDGRLLLVRKEYATERELEIGRELEE